MASKRRAEEDVSSTSDAPNIKKHLTDVPQQNHDAEPSSSAKPVADGQDKCNNLSPADEKYFRAYSDLLVHQDMINDHVRTNTYRCSIIQNYELFYNKIVLDVGCGTGILSLFCIKAGAKKVYAVDASPIMEQTRKIIQSNNADNRIILIQGKIEEIELPVKVDVIVSEWMGHMLFYESMLPSVLFARDKWLKETGHLFPNRAKLYMAPVSDFLTYDDRVHFWSGIKDVYNVDLSAVMYFAEQKMIETVHIHPISGEDVQAHKALIADIDLSRVAVENVQVVRTPFEFQCFGHNTVHGFALWFSVTFPGNFVLSTSPYDSETHWQQTVLYINPVNVRQDTVIRGIFAVSPNPTNPRFQNINVEFRIDEDELREYKYVMGDNIY